MKLKILVLLLSQAVIFSANAAIVCKATTALGGQLTLTLSPDRSAAHVLVTNTDGSTELEQDFKNVDAVWDGHETGLITAPGLSVKYQNDYGCIVGVVVTTNVRSGGVGFIDSLSIPSCSGGTTPDSLCMHH